MAKVECVYEECMLPSNNTYYLWQIGYMLIGLGVLFFRIENFTFFQTLLFLFPVILDIWNTNITAGWLKFVRVCFGVLDVALLICCLLGMSGVLQDTGKSFVVSQDYMYFSGQGIEKTTVGIIIAFNLIVPVMFYIGAPCQKAMKMLNKVKANH